MDMKCRLGLEDDKESTMAIVRGSVSQEAGTGPELAKKSSCKLQEIRGGQCGWRVINKGKPV